MFLSATHGRSVLRNLCRPSVGCSKLLLNERISSVLRRLDSWAELFKERIVARVSEILERAAARVEVTVAGLIEKAERDYDAAYEAKQYNAAMSAIKEIGVLSGKRVERAEQGGPGEFAHLENMSADELRAYIMQALGEDANKNETLN